jgi:hypothetical protein
MALSLPYLLTGQYGMAAQCGRRALELHPGLSSTLKSLLSALGHLGADAETATIRQRLLELEPGFTVQEAIARSPFTRQEDLACFADGPERSRPAMANWPVRGPGGSNRLLIAP